MSDTTLVRAGIDIVSEQDVASMVKNRVALERYFVPAEIDDCCNAWQDKIAAFARRLAAKEALVKATGRSVSDLRDIEISHTPDGRPVASWNYLTENCLAADISVSSSPPFAIAVAVIVSKSR